MGFNKGTWTQLPNNGTNGFVLSYIRCASYGTLIFTECFSWISNAVQTCVQWVNQTTQKCISWAWQSEQQCTSWASQTSQQCCTWWPCSWGCALVTLLVSLVCVVFAIVTTLVCVAFAMVVTVVCVLFTVLVVVVCAIVSLIVLVVCLLWAPVVFVVAGSNANGGTAFLLTDGSVMIQEYQGIFTAAWATRRWWKLSPDQFGSYVNGTWSALADSNVARRYFASAVLADGRLLVCGGEYSDTSGTQQNDWTNACEIFDPVANNWTPVAPPQDSSSPPVTWANIGDAPCAVLPNGKFLMGSDFNANIAKLDPLTLAWTAMSPRPTVSSSDEDSWVLMPDNTIVAPSCESPGTTWVYDILNDKWNQGNNLPVSVIDTESEIGPALLKYDGTAFFFGANQHTAIYSAGASPAWTNGSDLPSQNNSNIGIPDGPAALLANGNILFGASPIDAKGDDLSPTLYFEFDGTTFNRTNDPPNNGGPTYPTRLLLLPNGDVMYANEGSSSFFSYHSDAATPQDSFRPVIQICPSNIQPGQSIKISGTQFNGLSQAVAYGDDCQTATNYPLVRILNLKSNHLRYCRTANHTTIDGSGNVVPSMGVATGAAVVTTNVQVPTDLDLGDSLLFVVANGIPSAPFPVKIARR